MSPDATAVYGVTDDTGSVLHSITSTATRLLVELAAHEGSVKTAHPSIDAQDQEGGLYDGRGLMGGGGMPGGHDPTCPG